MRTANLNEQTTTCEIVRVNARSRNDCEDWLVAICWLSSLMYVARVNGCDTRSWLWLRHLDAVDGERKNLCRWHLANSVGVFA